MMALSDVVISTDLSSTWTKSASPLTTCSPFGKAKAKAGNSVKITKRKKEAKKVLIVPISLIIVSA